MNAAQKTSFRRLSPISDKIGSTDSAVADDPETFPPDYFLDFRVDHQSKIRIELPIRIRLLVWINDKKFSLRENFFRHFKFDRRSAIRYSLDRAFNKFLP